MWTRREAVAGAITAMAAAWTIPRARAQVTSAAATLSPTGKLRAAFIVSNPVLVTRSLDGTLSGVSVAVAREPAGDRYDLGILYQTSQHGMWCAPLRHRDSHAGRTRIA